MERKIWCDFCGLVSSDIEYFTKIRYFGVDTSCTINLCTNCVEKHINKQLSKKARDRLHWIDEGDFA